MKKHLGLITFVLLMLCMVSAGARGSLAVVQGPQPIPKPGSQLGDLKPLALVNVSLDGIAKPIGSSPTGTSFSTPEFAVPRSVEKILEIRTRDGRSNVRFSRTLPPGVPQGAVQFLQESVSAPNAVGRLRFSACPTCPATIAIAVSASDPSGTVSGQIKLNLTASSGTPSLTSIARNGGTEVRPRFEIHFAAGTFDPTDSQVVATYAGNLKYRLIPDNTSNVAGGSMFVVAERLKAERSIQVFLRNTFGASSSTTVQLPLQQNENNTSFECVNCSTVLGSVSPNDNFSVKHSNGGGFAISGTDEITITPLQTGTTACDQNDFIYSGASASWINGDGAPQSNLGTVSIASQPPANQLLRASQNRVTTSWTLNGLNADRFYQVKFRGINVVGVCSNRVLQ
ncbi:MAG: hypothetical protein ABI882_19000 [Acidobacteriota bacterium]